MRKQARSVLTGLLVFCCLIAGFVPVVHVQAVVSSSAGHNNIVVIENADLAHMVYPLAVSAQTVVPVESPSAGPWQAAWAWIQKAVYSTGTWIAEATRSTGTWIAEATRSTGAFIASVSVSIRDFFVSGQALKVLQTATQAITDFAVRLFLPLSVLLVPILKRVVSGLSVTPELVAVWMFWIIIVLALIILILALRRRHNMRERLPRVTPRTAGQGENAIEFDLVQQGPKPSPATSLDQLTRTHEKQETPPEQEPAAQPAVAEESSHPWLDSPSVPEISLEPLGFFAGADTVSTAVPTVPAAMIASAEPPLLEFTPPEAGSPATQNELSEPVTATPAVPADIPSEVFLTLPQESSSAQESPPETLLEPFPEPELTPIGQEAPVQSIESDPESPAAQLPETNPPTLPGADLLSRLLDDEEPFQQTTVAAGTTVPVPPFVPVPQPSVFSGNVELDTLLPNGVVTDADALAQLYRGGHRNRISKLTVSAKDLQNVPDEIRQVIKLTVVALSPIELSIARDLAMRLEAPGFVGEALLVAKKMGYENYLTTYKNISKNYKDVSIVDTASLKAPEISAESGEDLISFS